MEYNEIIKQIGCFGKYQKILVFLLAVPVVFDALTTFMLNFILGNQKYRCRIPGEDGIYLKTDFHVTNTTTNISVSQCYITINGTDSACKDWVYDQSVYTSTLVSKFDIVCTDKFIRSHILLSHFLGSFFSAATCGFMCDTWGRKPSLFIAISLLVIPNVIRPWMPNIFLVAVCEFLNAAGSNYSYFVPFIIVTELVGPSHRVLVSFIIYFSYCLGEYLLLVFAYFIRDWETLILAISAPITLSFFILFFVTESPRWLIVKGRGKEAMAIFLKAAKYNKKCVDFKVDDIVVKHENTMSLLKGLKAMVKFRTLMIRFLILIFNWFSISLIYYGISMNVGDLGGNVYTNYAASTTAETVAIILCLFTDKFSRKRFYCTTMIVGGVACLCTIFTSLFAGKSLHWMTIGLGMIGKLGVTAAFFLVFIVTSEIFPTIIRATVFGICNTGARIGGISSSYIGKLGVLIDTNFGEALPLIIFGSVGTAAGLLALFLPETRRIMLPETLDDALNINGETRKFSLPRADTEDEAML